MIPDDAFNKINTFREQLIKISSKENANRYTFDFKKGEIVPKWFYFNWFELFLRKTCHEEAKLELYQCAVRHFKRDVLKSLRDVGDHASANFIGQCISSVLSANKTSTIGDSLKKIQEKLEHYHSYSKLTKEDSRKLLDPKGKSGTIKNIFQNRLSTQADFKKLKIDIKKYQLFTQQVNWEGDPQSKEINDVNYIANCYFKQIIFNKLKQIVIKEFDDLFEKYESTPDLDILEEIISKSEYHISELNKHPNILEHSRA